MDRKEGEGRRDRWIEEVRGEGVVGEGWKEGRWRGEIDGGKKGGRSGYVCRERSEGRHGGVDRRKGRGNR